MVLPKHGYSKLNSDIEVKQIAIVESRTSYVDVRSFLRTRIVVNMRN